MRIAIGGHADAVRIDTEHTQPSGLRFGVSDGDFEYSGASPIGLSANRARPVAASFREAGSRLAAVVRALLQPDRAV